MGCICVFVFVFLYLCIRHVGMSFLISLNNPLFKNIPHVGSFWHFAICCICVFVRSTHGNMIFDILEQSSFQKYTTCWVFLALRHMLYLCICVFVHETLGNISFDICGPRTLRKCMHRGNEI